MSNKQSNRLTIQQKEGQGPITIFHADAIVHDHEVGSTSEICLNRLRREYPQLSFRHRKELKKEEINQALQAVDPSPGVVFGRLSYRPKEVSAGFPSPYRP